MVNWQEKWGQEKFQADSQFFAGNPWQKTIYNPIKGINFSRPHFPASNLIHQAFT